MFYLYDAIDSGEHLFQKEKPKQFLWWHMITFYTLTRCYCFCQVNGQWSAWFAWSKCDVTCGTGTKTRHRNCSEPQPSGGGHFCVGQELDTDTCTLELCPCKFQSICILVKHNSTSVNRCLYNICRRFTDYAL